MDLVDTMIYSISALPAELVAPLQLFLVLLLCSCASGATRPSCLVAQQAMEGGGCPKLGHLLQPLGGTACGNNLDVSPGLEFATAKEVVFW